MIDKWIAEATECDFKVALETKKPKSWLKSVSAFANGIGGTLIFGIDDNRNVVGLMDAQADAETISRLIKERITPYPNFILVPEQEDGKNILILTVSSGYSTPYYYKADGVMEAYIRIGNESVIAPSFALNQLILKGMNRTYDTLNSEYDFKDYAFSKLRERYKVWTGNSMEDKLFDSFDIRNEYGKLTNAGALLADDSPIRHSRLFCTRWNGLDKSGGMVDALDSAEYSGSLIILLNEGVSFVKRNMKTRWKKTANSRIEMPDYCERSVFEALVNALIHRDYLILGSEVHIDIYDDRLTIYSPGGMADGTRIQEAYIRIGNESVIAPSFALNQLILKGMNRTYDTLNSEYDFKDYAFSKLRERYKVWTGNSMEDKLFDSFDIRNEYGKLTNAGALLADDSPIRHSRLFCTRWNGLDKSGGMVDALDSAEYSGSLIILLNEGVSFVKRNMKTRWKKTANSRIEMPDYCERSVFEALVNALIHRDYLILGSEVHIDIYDDRLTIYSPGGMADGTRIQERDISNISSTRRNPVLADIFGRLGYMERQGSGFKKITESYHAAHNYRKELEPEFYSDVTSFQVTLYNLNYGTTTNSANVTIEDESVAITTDYVAIEAAIDGLNASQTTIKKAKEVYKNMGTDGIFGRSDISSITGDSVTAAGNLISKLKAASLIAPVKGHGKGKYRFIEPHN